MSSFRPTLAVSVPWDDGENVTIHIEQTRPDGTDATSILLTVNPDRAAVLAFVLAAEPGALAGLAGSETRQEVCDAWLIEGPHPPTHRAARNHLRLSWPRLARALDALTRARR